MGLLLVVLVSVLLAVLRGESFWCISDWPEELSVVADSGFISAASVPTAAQKLTIWTELLILWLPLLPQLSLAKD